LLPANWCTAWPPIGANHRDVVSEKQGCFSSAFRALEQSRYGDARQFEDSFQINSYDFFWFEYLTNGF
jgi:hypothetical protein